MFSACRVVCLLTGFFLVFIIRHFVETFFRREGCGEVLKVLTCFFCFVVAALMCLLVSVPLVALVAGLVAVFVVSLACRTDVRGEVVYIICVCLFVTTTRVVTTTVAKCVGFSIFSRNRFESAFKLVTDQVIMCYRALLLRGVGLAEGKHGVD